MNTKSKSERECIRADLLYLSQALFQKLLSLEQEVSIPLEEETSRAIFAYVWGIILEAFPCSTLKCEAGCNIIR
jgi:hypothetical protein